jgi:hypothetical protein
MNWSSDFLDTAVKNYKSTSSLLAMMNQSMSGTAGGLFG